MRLLYLVIPLLISLINVAVEAKAYRWVDNNGNVHYSDRKPRGKAKSVKTTLVKIKTHGANLPEVTIRKPIVYNKPTPSQSVKLGLFELKLPGANFRDIKIGSTYRGKNCKKKTGKLYWVQGNGYMDDIRMSKVLLTEFNHAGYRLYSENSGLSQPNARLLLKTQVVDIRLDRCVERTAFRKVSKDNAYLKIKWELQDSLSRKTLFKGTSSGSYKGFLHPARKDGTAQAIDRALRVASNNILAGRKFAKLLSKKGSIPLKKNNFELLSLNIKYSSAKQTFKKKIKQLQRSTVTIRTTKGHGSGVFVTKDGFILTNAHVVENETKVLVILNDKQMYANVIRVEPIRDIALLKITKKAKISISELSKMTPEIGDRFYVIGTPLSEELSHTVTSGILSAKRTSNGLPVYQTDAAINKGNSGGPIYNEKGELVAISVSGIFAKDGAGMGLNYLIPIDDALDSLNISRKRTASSNTKQAKVKQGATFGFLKDIFGGSKKTKKSTHSKKDVFASKEISSLYQKGLRAKYQRQFDTAEGLLERAVALIPQNNKSANAQLVRDELYYFLPLDRAKQAIENKDPKGAVEQVASVEKYIADHPKRLAYLKEISMIKETARYLTKVLNSISRIDAKRGLDYVKYFMREHFAVTGALPDTRYALSSLLDKRFGHKLSNSYELEDYEPKEDSYTIVFRSISDNRNITISERFQ